MADNQPQITINPTPLQPNVQTGVRFNEIAGSIFTVSSAPSGTPKKLSEQLLIYNNKLYYYDTSNNTWYSTASSTVYHGSVVSNASSNFPAGWSLSHNGAGLYTVTHNLGTTNYAAVVTCNIFSTKGAVIYNKGSNSFDVGTFPYSGAASDTDFDFILST